MLAFGLMAIAIYELVVTSFKDIFTPGTRAASPPGRFFAAVIYLSPAIYLRRYARGIRRLQQEHSLHALEDLLVSQRSFWKVVSILAVVMLAILALSLLRGIFR